MAGALALSVHAIDEVESWRDGRRRRPASRTEETGMRALVVYESMFGNTEHIANAIAEGLGESVPVETVEVGHAPLALPPEVDLVVVGGPTHAHGMTRPASRASAAGQVEAPLVSKGEGIREWIAALTIGHSVDGAAFDTRVNGPAILTGSASTGALKALRSRGIRADTHASFVLEGATGSKFNRIADTELERARAWGRSLAALLPVVGGTSVG
jgi:hypothetical protein